MKRNVKKITVSLIAAMILFTFCTVPNTMAASTSPITVVVDGKELDFDTEPIIANDRTLVPMRYIFNALGAEVYWDESDQTILAQKDDTTITIKIGNNIFYKNGEAIDFDVPAHLINGRTLIPVRAVAQALDSRVEWDGDLRLVSIDSNPNAVPLNGIKIFNENDNIWKDTVEYNYDLDGNGKYDNIQLVVGEDGGFSGGKDIWNNRLVINGINYTITDGRSTLDSAYIIDIDKSDNFKEIAVMLHYISNHFDIFRYENGEIKHLGSIGSQANNNPHLIAAGNKLIYNISDDLTYGTPVTSIAEEINSGILEKIVYNRPVNNSSECKSLGRLQLGLTPREVQRILGNPEDMTKIHYQSSTGEYRYSWGYASKGVGVEFVQSEYEDNENWQKQASALAVCAPCQYKTPEGIGIGSTYTDVINTYKDYIDYESSDNTKVVVGSIFWGTIFFINNGCVNGIFVGAAAE